MTTEFDREATRAPALKALTKIARDAVEAPSSAELDRGLNALLTRIGARKAEPLRVVRWSLVGLAAVACGVLLFTLLRERSREVAALTYRIEGGTVLEGGYLRDSGKGGVHLFFNEGSKVALVPGARGRLRTVDKDGSRVVIDQGTASFDVARSKERRWFVEAGPFSVAVKGTLFTVSWDPSSERFELNLRHGSVVVSGPITSGDIELRAGQRLQVNLRKAETLITEEQPDDASRGTSTSGPWPSESAERSGVASAASPSGAATGAPLAAAAASTQPKVERRLPWAEQIASGHWDRILEEVERAGVDATLEKASSADLFALADAARYRRRTDLARAALLALRRRFPSSSRSLDATFLLGRVEESRDRGRALTWYDEYLSRAASGPYAAEAWGRKLALTNELKGSAAARPLAEEYLRRFPKGSYAETARSLCREP